MAKINVLEQEIALYSIRDEDYISLTDIARYKNQDRTDDLIRNWLRTRNTLEFLGIWEHLNNPDFNPVEFDGIKMQAGLNSFTLTPKQWIKKTKAVGLISKAGRYGGTYAHKDIAFEFASWVSVEFKLYLIKEFQRLKEEERKTLGWGEAFLMDHVPIAGRVISGKMIREDQPWYPPRATREALANALYHRDYTIPGGAVAVAMYDDHLEITNPGDFHFGITPEKLTTPHESKPWNPIIANIFYRADIIERWGTGTLNIIDWCTENTNPAPSCQPFCPIPEKFPGKSGAMMRPIRGQSQSGGRTLRHWQAVLFQNRRSPRHCGIQAYRENSIREYAKC